MQELSVYKKYFICYCLFMGKRTGRPKLPAEERKTEVLSLRFTKSELAKIKASAKKDEQDHKEWSRKRLISA